MSGHEQNLVDYCVSGVNIERLNIYRNGYFRSAIETLVSNYPAVYTLLGSELFRHLAKQFVVQHPPSFGSLVGYGVEFPAFLETSDVRHQLPYLSDIAKLDRGWLQVYFAADCEPLTPGRVYELLSLGGDTGLEKIGVVSALTLVSLSYPISVVWQLLKDNGGLDKAIELSPGAEHALIWRSGDIVLVRVLPAHEFSFFSCLLAGMSFEEAVESISEANDEYDMGAFFSELITAEILAIKTIKP